MKQRQMGRSDQGSRAAVTGGKQMDGFISLVREIVTDDGLPEDAVYRERCLELPGYFRPEKKWDVLLVQDGVLIAAIEFKSQVGPSFGNNFNNRSEEAIGSAQDIWTAYREGAFRTSERPWLGYVMMLEECSRSTSSVSVREPHFAVFPEFSGASYAKRYQLLLIKLVRERLYDSTCFLMSSRDKGIRGRYSEPDDELSFARFAASLSGQVLRHVKTKKARKKK